MELSNELIKYAIFAIIVVAGIIIFIYLLDQISNGYIGSLVCSVLFRIPFGHIFTALTQICAAVPS